MACVPERGLGKPVLAAAWCRVYLSPLEAAGGIGALMPATTRARARMEAAVVGTARRALRAVSNNRCSSESELRNPCQDLLRRSGEDTRIARPGVDVNVDLCDLVAAVTGASAMPDT